MMLIDEKDSQFYGLIFVSKQFNFNNEKMKSAAKMVCAFNLKPLQLTFEGTHLKCKSKVHLINFY